VDADALRSREVTTVVDQLTHAAADLVLAAWGATGRGEATRRSDLDLFCWNPRGVDLVHPSVRHAAYLDLLTCVADSQGLRDWALSNATDLHAVMFARVLRGSPTDIARFRGIVRSLWHDTQIRAREIYHLIGACIALPRLHGTATHRPEKFLLGATRCWTALAECAFLRSGYIGHYSTRHGLRLLINKGVIGSDTMSLYDHATELRRLCEDEQISHRELVAKLEPIGAAFLRCARSFISGNIEWLCQNAPISQITLRRLGTELLGAPDIQDNMGTVTPLTDADDMLRVLLSDDPDEIQRLVHGRPPHRNWWVRHAALMNRNTRAATLFSIVAGTVREQRWWPDRNLILYAIRHPSSDDRLVNLLLANAGQLRSMDVAAIAARRPTRADAQEME